MRSETVRPDTLFRYADEEDAALLSNVARETFWDTYGTRNEADNKDILAYMDSAYAQDAILAELANESILYLIAESGREVAGYAMLKIGSFVEQAGGGKPIEINRIYLRKSSQGKGLGRAFIERCFEEGTRLGCDVVWLCVWQHNEAAIGFYERMGMEPCGTHDFDLAGTSHTDLILRKDLPQGIS